MPTWHSDISRIPHANMKSTKLLALISELLTKRTQGPALRQYIQNHERWLGYLTMAYLVLRSFVFEDYIFSGSTVCENSKINAIYHKSTFSSIPGGAQ